MDRSAISGVNQNIKKRWLFGHSWFIVLTGLLMIGGLWLFISQQITDDYDRTIVEASLETMNITKAFEEQVRRVVSDADNDLLGIKRAYEKDEMLLQAFANFKESAAVDPSQRLVAIYDEQGTVIRASDPNALGVNRSDRDYFKVHLDPTSTHLFIGKPITGRMSGYSIIPLTRRINKPDGSFGGIVYVSLRSDYFLEYYSKIDLGQDPLISLTSIDGVILARQTGSRFDSGQDVSASAMMQSVHSGMKFGTHITSSLVDKIDRIVSFRVMSDYPLIISIAKNTRVALSGYERRKQVAILGTALTSLLIIVYSGLLVRRNEKSMKLTEAVQQEKDRLSSLIDSISDEVWFADAEKNFALANPAAVQEFGVEYVSSTVERLVSSVEVLRADGSPRPVEEAPPLRALEGEAVRNQLEIVRTPATGELRYREVNANPVRDSGGNIIGAVSVVRDITERKLAEERTLKLSSELADNNRRLQELNVTLQEEILERQTAQEELEAVNQRLEAASQAKSNFLANMSHELRTPLNAIIGFSEVLKDKIFGPLNTKQTAYVDNVVVSGQHLLSLVNDLLDLSKAEAGKMELERSLINIKNVCQDSIDLLRNKARKRKVRLSFAADKTVDNVILFADERKIKQILYNLIDNGIKYNKPGGSVAVTATKIVSSDQTSAIQIVVEDTGIGITSENLELLFNPFCQLSRTHTEPAEGAGLGLALTKRLVELHGGEIRVESEMDKWTRFSVWIPIQQEPARR